MYKRQVHAYENSKLIDVAVGGLGKVPRPRRTIMSTDGFVREGPLDKEKAKGIRILNGEIEDNGMLPFIARVEDVYKRQTLYWSPFIITMSVACGSAISGILITLSQRC